MTLGITKSYTPGAGDVSNSASYNTDIGALFDAFSGLEAQTSTLGGLTITPTSNAVTTFRVTNSSGTEFLRVDTTNSRLGIKATGRLNLDGATSETYLTESADDILDVYVGAANIIKITESTADKVEINASNLELDATYKLYLDGGTTSYISEVADGKLGINAVDIGITATNKIYLDGVAGTGDTYIYESAGNTLDVYVGGVNTIKSTATHISLVGIMGSFAAKSNDTKYLAESDGFVAVVATAIGGAGSATAQLLIGSSADIDAGNYETCLDTALYGGSGGAGYSCPVNKGQYWKVVTTLSGTGAVTARWMPLGA